MLRATRSPGLLAAALIAVAIAACGPTGPTPTPGGSDGAVDPSAPATRPPGTIPALPSDLPFPSFVLPSFNEDEELEALLPQQLGGTAISYLSMTGETFMGMDPASAAQFEAVLQEFDRTPADLSVAFGGTRAITLFAYQIRDVSASTFLPALIQSFGAQMGGVTTTTESYGGKSVTKLVPAEGGTVYLYTSGDVVFVVGGDGVTPALLDEAFTALP